MVSCRFIWKYASIGMEVELRDHRIESISDSGSVGDSDATNDNGNSRNNDGSGSNDDGNSTDHGGDDSSRSKSMIPIFSEDVGVVPDMSGKKPVDYYQLFISDHLRPHQ